MAKILEAKPMGNAKIRRQPMAKNTINPKTRIFGSNRKTRISRLFLVGKQVQHAQLHADRDRFKIQDHNNENPLGPVIFEDNQKSSGSTMVADKTIDIDGAATKIDAKCIKK